MALPDSTVKKNTLIDHIIPEETDNQSEDQSDDTMLGLFSSRQRKKFYSFGQQNGFAAES